MFKVKVEVSQPIFRFTPFSQNSLTFTTNMKDIFKLKNSEYPNTYEELRQENCFKLY